MSRLPELHECHRCGRRRVVNGARRIPPLCSSCTAVTDAGSAPVRVKPVQWQRDGLVMRPVDPERQKVHRVVAELTKAIHEGWRRERLARERATGRRVCGACGCLCLPDEQCPMCRVRLECGVAA